jgi:Na+/H+-translocating membrane pyrophosphatase
VIGDLVGDNIGHVAGIGTDLIASWIETTAATLYIFSMTPGLANHGTSTLRFPFFILACGIIVSMITSFIATTTDPSSQPRNVELTLRLHLLVTSALLVPLVLACIFIIMPDGFVFAGISNAIRITAYEMCACFMLGLFGTIVYGLISKISPLNLILYSPNNLKLT